MARKITGANDYLMGYPPPIKKVPFSISVFWKKDTAWGGPFCPVIWIGKSTVNVEDHYLFYINNSGRPYYAIYQGAVVRQIYAIAAASLNTWHHCAIVETGTWRKIYHNYHSWTTIGYEIADWYPTGIDKVGFGKRADSLPDGNADTLHIAEAAIWEDYILSDSEIKALSAKSANVADIKPDSLASYNPFYYNDIDLKKRINLTTVGTPIFTAHPAGIQQKQLPVKYWLLPIAGPPAPTDVYGPKLQVI